MKYNKDGTILVTSLWIMAILVMLAIGIGFRVSIEGRLARFNMDKLKALYLAKAGIVKAQGVLANDTNGYDSIWECGITLNKEKNETTELLLNGAMGGGSFVIAYNEAGKVTSGMQDEERKININAVPAKLPGSVLENLLGAYANKAELVSSVIGWKDPADNQNYAADESYYRTYNYERKRADFAAIEELRLVRGFSDQSPQNPKVFESIKDYVTVYGDDGKVNINTASEKVLKAFGLTDAAVGEIIKFRGGDATQPGRPFTNIASDIQSFNMDVTNDVPILTNPNYFKTNSTCFRIESEGTIAGSQVKKKIATIADRSTEGIQKLLYYREY